MVRFLRPEKLYGDTWIDPHLRQHLDHIEADLLRPTACALGLICLVIVAGHLLLLERPLRDLLAAVNLCEGEAYLGIYARLRRRPVSPAWAHPLALLLSVIALGAPTVHLIATQEMHQGTNFAIIVAGIGCILLSVRWLAIAIGVTLSDWALITWLTVDEPIWAHYSFMMLMCTMLSVLTLALRVRMVVKLEAHARIEARITEAQQLESVGTLATGVAHDIGNLVQRIGQQAQRAFEQPNNLRLLQECMANVHQAAQRAMELSRQMIAYAAREQTEVRAVDLNALIEEMLPLLRIGLSPEISIALQTEAALPLVRGNPTQLRQVLMNLTTNAGEAVRGAGSTITVETRVVNRPDDAIRATTWADEAPGPGTYVALTVTDTGEGLDPAVSSRVFSPLFSTKAKGRGLGLAAVRSIVREHGGMVGVSSEEGRGTCFEVLLPASPPAVPAASTGPAPGATGAALESATVIIAEDEVDLREVAREMLRMRGYTVVETSSAADTLTALDAHPETELVLLDASLAVSSGRAFLGSLRAGRPTIPVVLMSGLSRREVIRLLGEDGWVAYVQKPFSTAHLMETIEAARRDVRVPE